MNVFCHFVPGLCSRNADAAMGKHEARFPKIRLSEARVYIDTNWCCKGSPLDEIFYNNPKLSFKSSQLCCLYIFK